MVNASVCVPLFQATWAWVTSSDGWLGVGEVVVTASPLASPLGSTTCGAPVVHGDPAAGAVSPRAFATAPAASTRPAPLSNELVPSVLRGSVWYGPPAGDL